MSSGAEQPTIAELRNPQSIITHAVENLQSQPTSNNPTHGLARYFCLVFRSESPPAAATVQSFGKCGHPDPYNLSS